MFCRYADFAFLGCLHLCLPLLLLPILPAARAESAVGSVQVGIFGGNAVPEGYFAPGDTHWFVAAWDEGMTEGGSSGSPVFDDSQRIRGQLHGGYASCSFPCAHQPPLPGLSGRSFLLCHLQALNSTAVSELTAVAGFCFCADRRK